MGNNIKTISKAVIPCGGLGTRFLPITKAVPKEMLPLIDTPVLDYIVCEAIDSGITDILIILSSGKEAIINYFNKDASLIKRLKDKGENEIAKRLEKIGKGAKISFAFQKEPKGSGDAILYAEEFTNGEPFALAWGDDLIYSERPVIGQLIARYKKTGNSILGVQEVEKKLLSLYGVVAIDENSIVTEIVEKPKAGKAPSNLAALGRYILLPSIFADIKRVKASGELGLTDAIKIAATRGEVEAYNFIGNRYDMGNKLGALKAIVEYGLKNEEYNKEFKEFISKMRL